ncbi:3'-5' exonuclease family protein [Trichomonas vaginalis G3]|uniref:3'-5' exonuclease family protein n=1 Tax=Trichomonas vaginalis (strain ATCC PRA-98 / G3) TaxID=412133 RepID=A2DXJ3_TRIV3|nr:3'-5' exonuclease protein [Trichomonas vaginalis G3]EAY14822.1 3'-5' exonuclease family protein [Trichomonas vaginalis G3]KAI5541197.1 3'-5' exonuclease protein [Trichomonas vaginalis G3]|eukprot:XP_001327045.1 3'-5' exonuclease family protein [Trichomonas vaginalis G3]
MTAEETSGHVVKNDITNSTRIDKELLSKHLNEIVGEWEFQSPKEVEFFENKFTQVRLVRFTDRQLISYLNIIDDGKPIALDLEWNPFTRQNGVNLFQLCTSRGCLLIHRRSGQKNDEFFEFLKTHQFFMKDISNDYPMLQTTFGKNFPFQVCDVAAQILRPEKKSEKFEKMVVQFSHLKPTGKFKNKKISRSKWDRNLNPRQILYAAFDAVGLYACLEEFQKYKFEFLHPEAIKSMSMSISKARASKKEKNKPPYAKALSKKLDHIKIFAEAFETEKNRHDPDYCIDLNGVSELKFEELPMFADFYKQKWDKPYMNVEFVKGTISKVSMVLSSDPNLKEILHNIDDGLTMSLEIKYNPKDADPFISLIGICSSLGCLLIKCKDGKACDDLREFITNHKFVFISSKRIHDYMKKMFGSDFEIPIDEEKINHLNNYQHTNVLLSVELNHSDWNQDEYTDAMVLNYANGVSYLYHFITHHV